MPRVHGKVTTALDTDDKPICAVMFHESMNMLVKSPCPGSLKVRIIGIVFIAWKYW
jgi:hypothetical protein